MSNQLVTVHLTDKEVTKLIGLLTVCGLYQKTGNINPFIHLASNVIDDQDIDTLTNNMIEVAKENGFGDGYAYVGE